MKHGQAVKIGGLIGGMVLVLYGIIPTLQPAAINFGRVYAALRWGVYRAVLVVGLAGRS